MQAQACRASWCPHLPHANTHTQTHSLWHDVMRCGLHHLSTALHQYNLNWFICEQIPKQKQHCRRVGGLFGGVRSITLCFPNAFCHVSNLLSLLRSCAAGRFLAGSTAWPTSVPVCHSSRAACPKSGWRRLPYSPASARSCTEPRSWRRRRTPPPPPPWHPCPRACPRPPPALPLCPVTLATSPAGRRCELGLQTLNWFQRWTEEFLSDCIHPVWLLQWVPAGERVSFLSKGKQSWCWRWASIDPNRPLPAKKQENGNPVRVFHKFVFWIYQLCVPVCRWC